MNGEEFNLRVNECLRLLGTSYTARTENQLANAQDAAKEAKKLLTLAEGLAEWCCARVLATGGNLESI